MSDPSTIPVGPTEPPSHSLPVEHSWLVQSMIALAIVLPFLGFVAVPFALWGWGFSWVDLALLLGMYLLTGLGITVGFHRLFVHRSFETYTWVKLVFAVSGSMAVQGPLFKWVAMHRRHHQHSDKPDDPHSPHHHGPGVLGVLAGAWHSHMGWFFAPEPVDLDRYIPDLTRSRASRIISALFPLWIALGLVLPGVLGGVISLSWAGVLTGLLWGGLVRVFFVHHITWSVNSACHLWGRRPYHCEDESRNNLLFGILALGEGWHNTHHAFPTSARHGLRWWQVDFSYYVIRALAFVRLAWDVKLPTEEALERERRSA